MNVVDSSGWLEFLNGGPNAEFFAPPLEDTGRLIVPSICLYEVFRRVHVQRGEYDASSAASLMQQAQVVSLDPVLAVEAARLGLELGLPLADSIILATARSHDAVLWTQDSDFEGMEGVKFRAEGKPK